jgi:hypothetical protein
VIGVVHDRLLGVRLANRSDEQLFQAGITAMRLCRRLEALRRASTAGDAVMNLRALFFA